MAATSCDIAEEADADIKWIIPWRAARQYGVRIDLDSHQCHNILMVIPAALGVA